MEKGRPNLRFIRHEFKEAASLYINSLHLGKQINVCGQLSLGSLACVKTL